MGYTKIKTGKFEQFKCECSNIYDNPKEAESCQHDLYDGETGLAQKHMTLFKLSTGQYEPATNWVDAKEAERKKSSRDNNN